jgi:CheY-like chemotaxis protein
MNTNSQNQSTKALRVLLVEDEPALRDIYATKMRMEGFEVVEAVDGVDCLDKVQEQAPDVILLDVIMPMKNGFDTLRDLKANPRTRDYPVVIMSNLGQDYEVKRGIALGAIRFLTKASLTPARMVEEIRKALESPGKSG